MSDILNVALLSGFVAAVIAGAFQLVARRLDSNAREREFFNKHKVEQYFLALDAYASVENSLRALGAAMSGRKDPDSCESKDEKNEMVERDRRGAEAIEELYDALAKARHATLRLEILGSVRAMTDYQELEERINRYSQDAINEAASSGKFKGGQLRRLVGDVDIALKKLAENVRTDLYEIHAGYGMGAFCAAARTKGVRLLANKTLTRE